ncbi:MAG: response regulator transcription factor [Loktanella sp.]|nr:response regulator transcription factor [Loktanella sp.]
MRLDKAQIPQIQPVVKLKGRDRTRLLWFARNGPTAEIQRACEFAALDVLHLSTPAACFAYVAENEPDLVVHDLALTQDIPDFHDIVAKNRTILRPPMIAFDPEIDHSGINILCQTTSVELAFLALRAPLRRDRHSALDSLRKSGNFALDESSFILSCGQRTAYISKSASCILGPFFDLEGAVFDRSTLAGLAFGPSTAGNKIRSIDTPVARIRREIKKQIGIDPLRPVRGVGFSLNTCG